MTPEQIKAEHDRLRPILFVGAPKWVKFAAENKNRNWCWFEFKPRYWSYSGIWDNDNGRCKYTKNQPETMLDWTQTLIKRGDE